MEKYNINSVYEVKIFTSKFTGIPVGAGMLILTPKIAKEYFYHISKGKTGNLQTIWKDLAFEFHAAYTCPITNGIFLHILAEKAEKEFLGGNKKITNFWRMIDPDSPTASKLTFGNDFIRAKRQEEDIV